MVDPKPVLNLSPAEPDLRANMNLLKKEVMLYLNCHAIGTVQEFDSAKQTIKATIDYNQTVFVRQADGTYSATYVDYPILVDCPAIVLSGGLFSLKMPIKSGDKCFILFNDRDIDNWFASGLTGPVATSRLHSYSDAIILVGLRPGSNPLTGYESDTVVLGDGTHDLKLGNGKSSLKNGTTYIDVDANKIKLANSLTTLNTLLQSLCTQLQLITVAGVTPGSGVSGLPVNAAAIAAIATQISGLLE